MSRTFIMIKPDAVRNRHAGEIIARIEKEGFKILGMKYVRLAENEKNFTKFTPLDHFMENSAKICRQDQSLLQHSKEKMQFFIGEK